MQVPLFMHKIKTNSSPPIFLHQFQTINPKCATRNSRNIFKVPKRETNCAKYHIHARGTVIWNIFLNKTEKKTYYHSISLKMFEFEEELSLF